MARMTDTKMTVSLDNDSKRILRNLTKAIDRLTRNVNPYGVKSPIPEEKEWPTYQQYKRLTEPAEDLEPGEAQLRSPRDFESPQEAINRLPG